MLDEFYKGLDEAMRSGDIQKAELFLKSEIDRLESEGSKAGLAAAYSEMGSFYRGLGKYAGAAECFNNSLSAFASVGMETTVQYASVMLSQAGLFRQMGRLQESIALFLETKRLMEASKLDDMYLYTALLSSLSLVCIHAKEFDRAIEVGMIALSRARKGPETEEHELASALSSLASAYLGKGDLDSCAVCVGEALSLFESMPYENERHASALVTYGSYAYKRGEFPKAADAFEKSLPLTKRFFGINSEYIATCFNLYLTYQSMGEPEKARACLDEAYFRAYNLLGEGHPYTVRFARALQEAE
jgi:tetratricopeptide (TPR) repeat protein